MRALYVAADAIRRISNRNIEARNDTPARADP